ncbi:MAG: ATP-binding protein [Ignavibacteriaceae bacterium]|nr:ATP-binding protein [Ignavibacteriaceae bacterium]
MKNKISEYLKGDRKYFAIVFFILLLIFFVGLISPVLIEKERSDWDKELSDKILEIENGVKAVLSGKENRLVETKNRIKNELHKTLITTDYEYGDLISLANSEINKDYSVEVVAPNGKIIAWNNIIAIKQEEIFPFVYPLNEVHFFNSPLITYLNIIDTVKVQSDIFYLLISSPIEKNYSLQNKFFNEVSFSEELANRFNTLFNVYYDPYSQPSKDGRVHSIILLNSNKSKIGMVSFFKPSLNFEVSQIEETSTQIQILLLVIGLIFLTLGLKSDFQTIKWKSVRFIVLIIYLSALRFLFFLAGFPSRFLDGPLVDPSYFSSTFAWGIVKTPIEFIVTNIFLLIIGLKFFQYILIYSREKKSNRFFIIKIISSPLIALIAFGTLRGLAASIKSVIFDSTIRYFKEPDLIPSFPAVVMNLNVLIFGLASIFVIISLILLIGKFTKLIGEDTSVTKFIILFILIQIFCLIFFLYQSEPLITPLMCIAFISLIFFVIASIAFRKKNISIIVVYSSLIASVITISMLNYFNLELERRSLKVIAFEVNRANRELLSYLVDETLRNSFKNERLVSSLYKLNSNFDSEAFLTWSKSSLQRESLSSEILIFNRNFSVLGRFNVGLDENIDYVKLLNKNEEGINVEEIKSSDNGVSFAGIVPVKNNNITSGYVAVAANFNIENLGAPEFPDFLESNKAALGSVIDLSLVKIFEYSDGKVIQVRGNIFPSKEQNEQIFKVKLSPDNDGWANISLYGEDYITYILKTDVEGVSKTTAVSIKDKEITWSLYNFFKIFIIHSIFILIFVILLIMFRSLRLKYSFRTKLLGAFLLISIIPIVALAVYNREVVLERTNSAIFNELSRRSGYLENHMKAQKDKYPERSPLSIFENTGRESRIAFNIYDNSDMIYSSRREYYDNGLMTSKLKSDAHYNLNYLSYREYLTEESINNYKYDAYFRKINIDNKNFIIGVNDAFNKIELFYSPVDADVFLFGVYSFAVLIITILSTLFANQISSPIRKLTRATNAVAQGDLSVQLQNKEKGELKELFEGFNAMTNELQKNQNDIAELERENAWKEMAKQVAHEIKNPLTPMKLSVQQLVAAFNDKKTDFSETLKKLSQAILNQIDNLSLIASEFSSFAKMPSLKLEEFDLIPVIKDTINIFSDEEVKIEFQPMIKSVIVESDNSQMRRSFINLIRNSLQAQADLIKINLRVENGYIIIEVIDNGKGIALANQSKVFEANFSTKEKGLGLGLKLIKRFLENTNGEIILLSSTNEGTIFKIKIPIKNTLQTA